MINAPQPIDTISRVRRPVPPKAILWPTAAGYGNIDGSTDSTQFPDWAALTARKEACPALPLAAFTKAVVEAQHRILVVDDYLFKPDDSRIPFQTRVDQVLEWLPFSLEAYDVRLLTKSPPTADLETNVADQLQNRAKAINAASRYRENSLEVRVKFTLGRDFPHLHDRYAIIDDELWHFGATVGGFHRLVNAATRGWSVEDHGAVNFFEEAWGSKEYVEKHRHAPSRTRRRRYE